MDDDKKAREAVARRLRQQIENLTQPSPPEKEKDKAKSEPKSYREAIHERMRELDSESHGSSEP